MGVVQTVLTYLGGGVVVIGAVVGAAWGLFTLFGDKWLQSKFDRQLEDLRHKQAREMEEFRFEIGRMSDRSIKLNEKEFEIVPEAWRRLVDAFYATSSHVSSFRQGLNFLMMTDSQMEEALGATELFESQKQQVREAKRADRSQVYNNVIYWHDKARVEQTAREFTNYIAKYGIFISNKKLFDEIGDMIWDALLEYQLSREVDIKERVKAHELDKEGKIKLEALEAGIHRHFWKTELPAKGPVPTERVVSPPAPVTPQAST